MTDFNQAIILGNTTRDPELRYTANGQAVVSFSVATNRRWTNRETNELQESTEFHNIVAWGKLAEICNQILYKGRKVLVAGRLQTRNWEGQDGVKRYTTEIVADQISATGAPRGAGEQAITGSQSSSGQYFSKTSQNKASRNEKTQQPKNEIVDDKNGKDQDQKTKSENLNDEDINLDDIPF